MHLLLLAPLSLAAQAPVRPIRLDSGAVVRLQLHSGPRLKGKLLSPYATDSSRVRYCPYPAPPCRVGDDRYRETSAGDISSWEVHQGTGWRRGLIVGALAGAGAGYLLIEFIESTGDTPITTGEKFRVVVSSTAVLGGLGALIGSAFERWGRRPER
jgi:hypothetical protein